MVWWIWIRCGYSEVRMVEEEEEQYTFLWSKRVGFSVCVMSVEGVLEYYEGNV